MNPKQWIVYDSNKILKPEYGKESLYLVKYGEFDDYPDGITDMEILMRKSIYLKILSGEYFISEESSFKRTLILLDKKGNKILPLSEGYCY